MTNNTLPDENIQNPENAMPESVRNLISARVFREITDDGQNEKEKRD